jgi:prevent-host-death family protein
MSINIHDAKTGFSRLVARAESGETVIIARAGRPVAQVTAIGEPTPLRRTGFLEGEARVPDDFNEWGAADIGELFGVGG